MEILQIATYVGTSLSLVALTATVVILVLLRYISILVYTCKCRIYTHTDRSMQDMYIVHS